MPRSRKSRKGAVRKKDTSARVDARPAGAVPARRGPLISLPCDPSAGVQVVEVSEAEAVNALQIEKAAAENASRKGERAVQIEMDCPSSEALAKVCSKGPEALADALFPGEASKDALYMKDVQLRWTRKHDLKRASGWILRVAVTADVPNAEVPLVVVKRALQKWKANFWQGRYKPSRHGSAVCDDDAVGIFLTSYDPACADIFAEVKAQGPVRKQPLRFQRYFVLHKLDLPGGTMEMREFFQELVKSQDAAMFEPARFVPLADGGATEIQGAVRFFVDKVLRPAAVEAHKRTGIFTEFALAGVFRGRQVKLTDATGISVRVHRDKKCLSRGGSSPASWETAIAVLKTVLGNAAEKFCRLYDPSQPPSADAMSMDDGDLVSSLGGDLDGSAASSITVEDLEAAEPPAAEPLPAAPVPFPQVSARLPATGDGIQPQLPSMGREGSCSQDALATAATSRGHVDYSVLSPPTHAPASGSVSPMRIWRSPGPVRLPTPNLPRRDAKVAFAMRLCEKIAADAGLGSRISLKVREIVLDRWEELAAQ